MYEIFIDYHPVWGSPQLLFDLHNYVDHSQYGTVEIITQKTYILSLDFSQTSYTPDQRTDVKVPYSTKLWQYTTLVDMAVHKQSTKVLSANSFYLAVQSSQPTNIFLQNFEQQSICFSTSNVFYYTIVECLFSDVRLLWNNVPMCCAWFAYYSIQGQHCSVVICQWMCMPYNQKVCVIHNTKSHPAIIITLRLEDLSISQTFPHYSFIRVNSVIFIHHTSSHMVLHVMVLCTQLRLNISLLLH